MKAQLNGRVLSQLHPVYAEIGTGPVRLVLRPTLAPFTMMERDNFKPGQNLISFNAASLELSLETPTQVWARFAVDLHENDLEVGWDGDSRLLAFELRSPHQRWTALDWAFTGCERQGLAIGPSSCENDVIAPLHAAVAPLIEALLADLLEEVPAPMFFDAEGAATSPGDLVPTETETWRYDQVLSVFGHVY